MKSERNKKIVITSSKDNFDRIKDRIVSAGFEPVLFSVIEIKPVEFNFENRRYDWVIFTSKNSVKYFVPKTDKNFFKDKKIASTGSETAGMLEEYSLKADFVPQVFNSVFFIDEFCGKYETGGKNFLMPASSISGKIIEEGLKGKGAFVEKPVVYETVMPETGGKEIKKFMQKAPFYFIIFSSPSTVRNFMKLTGGAGILKKSHTAAIGSFTAGELEKTGIKPDVTAKKSTFEGVMEEIEKFGREGL